MLVVVGLKVAFTQVDSKWVEMPAFPPMTSTNKDAKTTTACGTVPVVVVRSMTV
jgi:hypothetical protein